MELDDPKRLEGLAGQQVLDELVPMPEAALSFEETVKLERRDALPPGVGRAAPQHDA